VHAYATQYMAHKYEPLHATVTSPI
jgi:hypothetical protein